MGSTAGILALISDADLRDDVDRITAAAGVQVVHASEPSGRKVWTGAVAVLLDREAAHRCARRALPRRGRVILVSTVGARPRRFPGRHRCRRATRRDPARPKTVS